MDREIRVLDLMLAFKAELQGGKTGKKGDDGEIGRFAVNGLLPEDRKSFFGLVHGIRGNTFLHDER